MEDLNSTIDPTCLQDPPLAIDVINQLDMFGIALYSILTFMATVSLVLYLEECVYVYKKVPAPKKMTIIWVNGAAPVIAIMSCLGMWIPRSTMFTDMTSNSYFAIVVYKFLKLILEELGGEEAFLKHSAKKPLRISTGPCCCCCPCLPRVPVTRRVIFLLKLGSLQYAILKTALSIFSIVLWTNGNFDLSDLEITGAAIWINPFIGVLTITALWPVSIMFMHNRITLRSLKIIPKYAMYQLVLVLSQLQASIISILSLDGTIACSPPFSSIARGSMLSQQLMIVEMFIVTLVTRLFYRRTYAPLVLDQHESDNTQNDKMILSSAIEENAA
ncbi:organic solute transporter subunit alpha-like [Clupea harengus]|uniref:Organic solute transporter subunit alpha-like n=1 Tax=Clupea harengus TaxID=7950 RepID=A0A8M1KFY3_CLUHA|nr:organic solute transporter subunit alpha-like [Clupea harengus]XP_042562976.1 organic solute transporter subunit alpha-like [Clupea harengus]